MIKGFFKSLVFLLAIGIVLVLFDRFTPYSVLDRLKQFGWPPSVLEESIPVQPIEIPFFKLSLDEKIKRSSIVVRTEYIDDDEILVEILKQDDGVDFYFDIGDEYNPFEGYRDTTVDYGEGNVVFLTGSPANLKMSMAYSDNQVPDQNNVTLDVIREKCGVQPIVATVEPEPVEAPASDESTTNEESIEIPATDSPDIASR